MADREMVIKGLECCLPEDYEYEGNNPCIDCPYYHGSSCGSQQLLRDALELLRGQEPVKQKTGHWIWLQYCANEGVYCSECHTKIFDRYPMKKKLSQFCGHCGAKMGDQVEGR